LTIPESLNGRFVIFRWRQRAHDDGEDQWGLDNVRILTRRSAPPAAPGLALVGGALPTEVTIFWLPVDSAYYYLVERREGTNGPWVEISKIDEPKTYYTDSIAEDRVYAYRVIAGNQSGLSAPTPTIVAGALTSIQAWKMREFGNVAEEGIARNGFVHPSGWTTLELYAFGLSHRSAPHALDLERPARGGIPRFEIERASGRFSLTLLKRRDGSEPAIVYAVETADSIHGPWSPSGAMVVLEVIDEDWELVQWTDGVGLDDVESRYVRWRILEK